MEALSTPATVQAAPGIDLLRGSGHATSVLCVGQDAATCAMVQHVLAEYDVVFASNAEQAVCTVNKRPFDLYVLEYYILGWCGASLCRDIRKADPHVPVCFVTRASAPSERVRALRAGANTYIVKPVDPPLLEDEISALVQSRAQCNETARLAALSAVRKGLWRRFAIVSDPMRFQQLEPALKRGIREREERLFSATAAHSPGSRLLGSLSGETRGARAQR